MLQCVSTFFNFITKPFKLFWWHQCWSVAFGPFKIRPFQILHRVCLNAVISKRNFSTHDKTLCLLNRTVVPVRLSAAYLYACSIPVLNLKICVWLIPLWNQSTNAHWSSVRLHTISVWRFSYNATSDGEVGVFTWFFQLISHIHCFLITYKLSNAN